MRACSPPGTVASCPLHCFNVQTLFVAKMVVHTGDVHIRGLADLPHRRALKAFVGEHHPGGLQQPAARIFIRGNGLWRLLVCHHHWVSTYDSRSSLRQTIVSNKRLKSMFEMPVSSKTHTLEPGNARGLCWFNYVTTTGGTLYG
jgi:hypothetical protein